MLQPYELLIIASQLSILTYYIGVVIYSIPIPDYRLKRWAPIMVRDGMWIAVLVMSFSLLLKLSDIVASYSGYSLGIVAKISDDIIATVFSYNFMIRIIAALVSLVPGATTGIVYAAALPFFLTQYTVLWAAITILLLTLIVAAGKSLLAALGVALMAIPFRIGRSAGASLLAFALVANAMLPYFPAWFETLAGIAGVSYVELFSLNSTYYTVWGVVRDSYGGYPSYSAIMFERTDGSKIFTFKVNSDGTYIVSIPYYVERGEYHVYLDYMGILVRLNPPTVHIPQDLEKSYEYVGVEYRLDLYASDATVFLRPVGVLVKPRHCAIEYVAHSQEANIVSLVCAYNWTTVQLYVPEECKTDIMIGSGKVYAERENLIPWRGVMVRAISIAIASPTGHLALEIKESCQHGIPKPLVQEGSNKASIAASAIGYLLMTILIYPLAVFSYITILSMIVLGLARSIGAVHPRIIFDI